MGICHDLILHIAAPLINLQNLFYLVCIKLLSNHKHNQLPFLRIYVNYVLKDPVSQGKYIVPLIFCTLFFIIIVIQELPMDTLVLLSPLP